MELILNLGMNGGKSKTGPLVKLLAYFGFFSRRNLQYSLEQQQICVIHLENRYNQISTGVTSTNVHSGNNNSYNWTPGDVLHKIHTGM